MRTQEQLEGKASWHSKTSESKQQGERLEGGGSDRKRRWGNCSILEERRGDRKGGQTAMGGRGRPWLTLHVEREALPEAVQVIVDDASQGLPVGFPAGHQAVTADDCHCAIGVPNFLVLCLAL